jgi:hypothetical protein
VIVEGILKARDGATVNPKPEPARPIVLDPAGH